MAKIQDKGLNDYIKSIKGVGKMSDDIIYKSVYKGAGIVIDAVKDEIKDIPMDNGYGFPEKPISGISSRRKADLVGRMGIAPIQEDSDSVDAKVGWDGYGRDKMKKHPKGVPNQAITRSVDSGTSFRKKNPFVNKAVTKNRKTAVKVMTGTIENEIKKEMK